MTLPLPRPASERMPEGPFMRALNEINAYKQANALRKIKEAEAQYAPQTVRANAMSKLAYANLMGPQFLAKLLQNQEILANTPDARKRALLEKVEAVGANSNANPLSQEPPQAPRNGSPNSIVDMMKGLLGIDIEPKQMATQTNQLTQAPEQGAMSSADQLPLSPQQVNALQQRFPNAVKPIEQENPMAAPPSWAENVGAYQGEKERGKAEGKGAGQAWVKQNEENHGATQAAQSALNDVQRFKAEYEKLKPWERGPGFGALPALSPAKQTLQQIETSMQTTIARAMQSGHITDKDFGLAQKLKVNASLGPKAVQNIENFLEGTYIRGLEKSAFDNRAQDMHLKPYEANLLWNKYIRDKPFFDAKSEDLIDKNFDKWPDYLSPGKRNEILKGNVKFREPQGAKKVKEYTHQKYGNITDDDIETTAKENNMTVQAVRKKLGID